MTDRLRVRIPAEVHWWININRAVFIADRAWPVFSTVGLLGAKENSLSEEQALLRFDGRFLLSSQLRQWQEPRQEIEEEILPINYTIPTQRHDPFQCFINRAGPEGGGGGHETVSMNHNL